jgi:hypothetical protein
MKKAILTGLLIVCIFNSYSLTNLSGHDPQASQIFIPLPETNTKICLTDYVKLNIHRYKELTGRKLNWKEAIALKSTQKQIKKIIRKDGTIDTRAWQKVSNESFKFHWGGFLLGLLIPVGFIITLFFKDKNKKNRTKSALYGMLLVLAIGATLLVLSLLANAY